MKPDVIQGGEFEDARGRLIYFNDFHMKEVRRFYVIEHPDTSIVRAWQGHKVEQKWFYVIQGRFKIVLVEPDEWEDPSDNLTAQQFTLSSNDPKVLHVPGNFANGFKALEANSKIMVFSSLTVEESSNDNYRFDKNKWHDWK
jgi:dTDP-4-dehydrorhamnose 3,5-epimerase